MKVLSLLLLFVCTSLATAQTVPSSCDAPDSVKDLYRADAAVLVLYGGRHTYIESDIAPDLKDSVLVPSNRIDSFLKPMLAVLNALTLFPKDSVAAVDDIHQYRSPLVKRIRMQVDTGSLWGKNLANGIIPTGDPTVDSILDNYQIFLDTSYQHQTNEITIELESKITINVIALAKILDSIPGVADTYNHVIGDGDFIGCQIANDTATLLCSMGWGDCPAGCTERRSWKFTVFPDCSVRFDGSYGDQLPSWSVYEPVQRTLSLYPNPVIDKLIIETDERGTAIISDVGGKEIRTAVIIEGKNELIVSELPSGVYFISLRDRAGNVRSGRFIKQ